MRHDNKQFVQNLKNNNNEENRSKWKINKEEYNGYIFTINYESRFDGIIEFIEEGL